VESSCKDRKRGDAIFCDNPDHLKANHFEYARCPYGAPGDRLWVRETFAHVYYGTDGETGVCDEVADMPTKYDGRGCCQINYKSDIKWGALDYEERGFKWRPSIHMPRWASRILLEVKSVRVERVRDITDADSLAEGIRPSDVAARGYQDARVAFMVLWNSINKKRGYGWDKNPWVWVVEFEVVE
jgi:hypothetical protein